MGELEGSYACRSDGQCYGGDLSQITFGTNAVAVELMKAVDEDVEVVLVVRGLFVERMGCGAENA